MEMYAPDMVFSCLQSEFNHVLPAWFKLKTFFWKWKKTEDQWPESWTLWSQKRNSASRMDQLTYVHPCQLTAPRHTKRGQKKGLGGGLEVSDWLVRASVLSFTAPNWLAGWYRQVSASLSRDSLVHQAGLIPACLSGTGGTDKGSGGLGADFNMLCCTT